MLRLAIGLGLVAGAAYYGRRTSSGLSGPPRTFLERTLDDVGQFALVQYPREELAPGTDPRLSDPDHQVQCEAVEPYLAAALKHLDNSIDAEDVGAASAKVVVSQAWSAAAQPGACPKLALPEWMFDDVRQ